MESRWHRLLVTYNVPDWPEGVAKPELPHPYEWVCLRPALGIKLGSGHPWWIRVKRAVPRGRMLKVMPDFFDTPQEAIGAALAKVQADIQKRIENANNKN